MTVTPTGQVAQKITAQIYPIGGAAVSPSDSVGGA
jgi:hypothetical protein